MSDVSSTRSFDLAGVAREHVFVLAALLCAGYAFYGPMNNMYFRWMEADSYYSHGVLIPLVSLWLVWRERQRLWELPRGSWQPGLALVALAVLLYLYGEFQAAAFPTYVALVLLLAGGVGYLYGKAVLWAVLFPILFLGFMLPLPGAAIAQLTYSLKYAATNAAVLLVQAMGIVCQQKGSEILFVHEGAVVPLTVGDVCSGLRSLIALLAMGTLFGYISRHALPWRLLLFALSVPIAFITNVLRIWTLCLVAAYTGGVEQWVHDWTGYMIYAVALAMMLGLDWLFGLLTARGGGAQPAAAEAAP